MTRLLALLLLLVLPACASNDHRSGSFFAAPYAAPSGTKVYWVCHGGRHATWKRVPAPAVRAHRRHGDRIVYTRRVPGTACAR